MGTVRMVRGRSALHSTRSHWEHQREDMFAEADVEIPGKAARDLHVCNIEELLIGAPREKPSLESFRAQQLRGAITAADVCAFRLFNAPCIVLVVALMPFSPCLKAVSFAPHSTSTNLHP